MRDFDFDNDSFEANDEIINTLNTFNAEKTSESKMRFFRTLKSSDFLIPRRPGGKGLSVLNVNKSSEAFIPLFTSLEEFEKWVDKNDRLCLTVYEEIKNIVMNDPHRLDGIVINPFGKALFLRQKQLLEIDSAVDGFVVERSKKAGEQHYFIPFFVPSAFMDALTEFFEMQEFIYSAYLVLAQCDDDINPHLVIVSDFDGQHPELFPALASWMKPFTKRGDRLELMKADFSLLQSVSKVTKPFYKKD